MAADLAQLRDLRERLTKATGPDRQLDVRVQALLEQPGEWAVADIEYACTDPDRVSMPKAYTASMDAAWSLIERQPAYRADPDDYYWELGSLGSTEPLDMRRPIAPQIARGMLLSLCSALIAEMEAVDA